MDNIFIMQLLHFLAEYPNKTLIIQVCKLLMSTSQKSWKYMRDKKPRIS